MKKREIWIIYTASDKVKFLFVSEFLKLCGFFVVGIHEEEKEALPKEMECTIYLKKDPNVRKEKLLNTVVKEIAELYEIPVAERNCLKSVYKTYKLMKNNLLERYFYTPSDERIEACRKSFEDAYAYLENWTQGKEAASISVYTKYFMLACQEKINFLRRKQKEERKYDSQEMIARALSLHKQDNSFWQGYLLAGIIADGDKNYIGYSCDYYQAAAGYSQAADGYIYYRLAHYYEKALEQTEKALELYQKAEGYAPYNYRITYKIAFLAFTMGNVKESAAAYHKVCQLLEKEITEDGNDLEPMQIEYLFKAYKKLFDIYDIWQGDKETAKELLEKILKIKEYIKKNRIMRRVFGKDEREMLISHLGFEGYEQRQREWRD